VIKGVLLMWNAFVALVLLAAAVRGAPDDTISVCGALSVRSSLSHKVVSIRGLQSATGEGAWLIGTDCGESISVGGRPWRTSIWLELSAQAREAVGIRSGGLETSMKRVNSEIEKAGFDAKRDRLWVTYIGLFEVDDDNGRRIDSDGSVQAGFGHLNAAHAQLIVSDVRDPVVEHIRNPADR
jgi:hypothetical protein